MDNNEKKVLLSIQNLDVVFGHGKKAFKAVDNVSFDIYKGETFSLVGESGSGKTTIGRSVIRLYKPTAGKITFDGTQISGRSTSDIVKSGISQSMEGRRLRHHQTAAGGSLRNGSSRRRLCSRPQWLQPFLRSGRRL